MDVLKTTNYYEEKDKSWVGWLGHETQEVFSKDTRFKVEAKGMEARE